MCIVGPPRVDDVVVPRVNHRRGHATWCESIPWNAAACSSASYLLYHETLHQSWAPFIDETDDPQFDSEWQFASMDPRSILATRLGLAVYGDNDLHDGLEYYDALGRGFPYNIYSEPLVRWRLSHR